MTHFIGIDVSKDKFDLGWLRDIQTGRKKTRCLRNSAKGHQQAIEWIEKNTQATPEECVLVVEPTGIYHEGLIYALHDRGFKILLINPGKARQYAKALNLLHKTDKLDAIMLAHYGHAQHHQLTYWQPEAPHLRELKAMLRRLDALEKDLRREQNRQEATEFSLTSERVVQSLKEMIETLKDEIARLQEDIDNHINRYPELKKNRELLESIKGIGPVMAREMVYLLASRNFTHAKQVAAYLGIVPQQKESGKFKGQTRLSKNGSSRIRAKLYMAAVSASTHNPDIKAQRDRLLAAGKTKMQALGAAMRKLVQICFGVIKHQNKYQPQVVFNT